MEYNKIISVTGLGGLYELIGSKTDGAIVRSLEDNTTKFVSSRVHQFSHLESIEVFTVRDNVNLTEVFSAIKNASKKIPDYKDIAAVKEYFETVYPDMDFDRVYVSDMKKMIRWYGILEKNNIDFSAPVAEEVQEQPPIAEEQKPLEEEIKAPAKKAKAAKKKEDDTSGSAEDKPKKKAASKKKKTEE